MSVSTRKDLPWPWQGVASEDTLEGILLRLQETAGEASGIPARVVSLSQEEGGAITFAIEAQVTYCLQPPKVGDLYTSLCTCAHVQVAAVIAPDNYVVFTHPCRLRGWPEVTTLANFMRNHIAIHSLDRREMNDGTR